MSQILDRAQTLQKIKRIAYQIHEANFQEEKLILVGIKEQGFALANMLMEQLQKISPIKIELVSLVLDKNAPLQSEIILSRSPESLERQVIILVDDVLNSGKTLAYSLKPFLNIEVKKIQTVVMIDRGHRKFPLSADFIGYSLSTTLKEHIEVVLSPENVCGVYLK